MKKIINLSFFVALFILMACGGKSGSLKPSQVKISGPLGEYFEVVDREYTIKDGKIVVEIKRIKEGLPAPWKEGMEVGYSDGKCEPHFNIEIRDEGGDIISQDQTDIVIDDDELIKIVALGIDETGSIKFDAKGEGAVSFKIGSTFKVHEEKDEDSSYSSSDENSSDDDESTDSYAQNDDDNDAEDSSVSSSSGSEDWDSVLDSYERYVDKYIALMKKAKAGDASAMTEYPSLMEEAQEYGDKLQNASGSLSPSQIARYQRINNKMLRAAQ